MHTNSRLVGRVACAAAALLLLSCGGGGGDPEVGGGAERQTTFNSEKALPSDVIVPADSGQAPSKKERALSVPSDLTIPPDASMKGVWGPATAWPLIAVHGVLTSDGRVVSYGTKADGTQTGFFIYDIWNPADDSHMTVANGTGTDIFCSSQVML